jgi:hypothetical protein
VRCVSGSIQPGRAEMQRVSGCTDAAPEPTDGGLEGGGRGAVVVGSVHVEESVCGESESFE